MRPTDLSFPSDFNPADKPPLLPPLPLQRRPSFCPDPALYPGRPNPRKPFAPCLVPIFNPLSATPSNLTPPRFAVSYPLLDQLPLTQTHPILPPQVPVLTPHACSCSSHCKNCFPLCRSNAASQTLLLSSAPPEKPFSDWPEMATFLCRRYGHCCSCCSHSQSEFQLLPDGSFRFSLPSDPLPHSDIDGGP